MTNLTKWAGVASDGRLYDYQGNLKYCDNCGENVATEVLDMYYNDEYWCQECCDKSADSEPNYDVETQSERDTKAWQQKLMAKG